MHLGYWISPNDGFYISNLICPNKNDHLVRGFSQLENGGSFHRFLGLFTSGYCISPDIWDNLEQLYHI